MQGVDAFAAFAARVHKAITEFGIDLQRGLYRFTLFRTQQFDFVQYQQWGDTGVFTRHQIAVNDIKRQVGLDRRHHNNLIDVGCNGFYAVVEIRAR